jgi:hypothetical protein
MVEAVEAVAQVATQLTLAVDLLLLVLVALHLLLEQESFTFIQLN